MKKNTIRLALNAKVKEILATVEDETVKQIMHDNILICGGAIASMLLGERPNDYDIYFRTFESAEAVAKYYVDVYNANNTCKTKVAAYTPEVRVVERTNIRGEVEKRIVMYMKSSGVAGEATDTAYEYFEQQTDDTSASEFIETTVGSKYDAAEELAAELKPSTKRPKFRPVFLTDNAISLSDKVQLIVRFYGEPADIHLNYDFAHAMCSYDHKNGELKLHQEALESLLSKALLYKGSLYPIASLFRIRKFMRRGWTITAGQMLKIVWQVNELDLKDMEVLKDQLMGVDQAYMHHLIRVISNKEKHESIDSIYIAKIIDEIFD